MPLFDDAGNIPVASIVRPGQIDQTGDIYATAVTEYGTSVEHTIARKSKLHGFIPVRPVRGTNKIGSFAFGKSTIQKLTVGQAPAGTTNDIGKTTLTVDTVILTRHTTPLLEEFQTSYNARTELGVEDGIEMAKFIDQSYFIQAAKAAAQTQSRYSTTSGKPAGFGVGSTKTLAASGDATDPAKLYAAIRDLFVTMEAQDVTPGEDDVGLAFRPQQFYALQDAEQIINGMYITSNGTKLEGIPIFKAFGCPVWSTNNMPSGVISGHHLSNADNSNAYDGDFTKLVGLAFSPKALLAGETIPLEHDVWWNKEYKMWFIDSHTAYGVTMDRVEYAGRIVLP
jgi:hypothetical protein